MRLTKRTILILIALVIISLVGIIGLQLYLLKNAYEQKEEAFKQSVGSALAAVNDGLETGDAVSRIFAVGIPHEEKRQKRAFVSIQSERHDDSVSTKLVMGGPEDVHQPPMKIVGNMLSYSVGSPQHVSIHVFDMLGREDTTVVDTFQQAGEFNVRLSSDKYSKGEYFYKYTADSSSFVVQVMQGTPGGIVRQGPGEHREKVMRDVVDQLISSGHPSIEKRIKPALLDSLVRINLKEAGIDLPYAYGVIVAKTDSLQMVSQQEYAGEIHASEFRARLFPAEIFSTRNDLALYFPGRKLFLLRSMAPLVGATVLFMGGIIFAFVYTLKAIFKQKELSDALIEFINNMTHEFKTPISTIALASEAIARPDILPDGEKVLRYNGIIHDENTRMKQQVDKILQMAVLEEGDLELNIVPLDVHAVIRKAVENVTLQVEQKGGAIVCKLGAGSSLVNADLVHLANVVHNVLDNANKYSPEAPRIEVSTWNADGLLKIAIRDEGIGMKEEDAKRAFEKYFRVSTGNQHDVKGFGLGLSYVKLIVEAQKGSVSLASSPGRGTTVELAFPVVNTNGEGKA
jgi:signal transduction histidine kinase